MFPQDRPILGAAYTAVCAALDRGRKRNVARLVLRQRRWHPAGVQSRLDNLTRFYSLLGRLERHIGGRRLLTSSDGRSVWPERGVYFFMENGESRTDSGEGPRHGSRPA